MAAVRSHHPPTPSSEEEGEQKNSAKTPSSSEEGAGGGVSSRQILLRRAAEMRRDPTEPERRLWMALRDRRFRGYKFRRQAIIGNRIADFFCPAGGLLVELDGETHDRESDLVRDTRLMREIGFTTIRFTNEDVMRNMEGVMIGLETALARQPERWPSSDRHHPPAPSSEEEGE